MNLLNFLRSQVCRSRNTRVSFKRPLRMESLEDRRVLTTTLFLDFGGGIGMTSVLSSTAAAIRDIDGVGLYGYGTGPNLTVNLDNPLLPSSSLDFRPLSYDFDLNGTINNADTTALANAVLPLVQRALEPFDIDVVIAGASTIAGIVTSFDANNAATNGRNDAYVLITDTRSNFFGGGSVGDSAGFMEETEGGEGVYNTGVLNGIAAADDLNGEFQFGTGNLQDELALTFSDVLLASARSFTGVGTGASAILNENLANRIAFTATHEAFHTFGLIHTVGTGNQDLLSSGDVIRAGLISDAPTRLNPFTVTRATLQHQSNPVAEPNNYLYTKNDPDIGLRDTDGDSVPDLAYVTGTGAFDKITLTRDASNANLVHVTVAAYSNSAFTTLIQTTTYDINLSTDTEGEILIDSTLSSDLVEVDARINASFRIRGNTGDDQVKLIGNGSSLVQSFVFDGEKENDTFTINYDNGDPLPQAGFDFNFIGGTGTDNTVVIDASGVQRSAFFVNTLTDGADVSVGNGRADANAATDDQTTLRAAIQEANFAGTPTYVFVPKGTYNLTLSGTGGDTQGDLDITGNVTIVGAGAGATIIDSDVPYRVFVVNSNGASLNLSRLTVTGGNVANSSGGGIYANNNCTVVLDQVAIVDNQASSHGGGVFVGTGANVTIVNSVITENTAGIYGGGILANAGSLSIGETIIASNTASSSGNDIYGTTTAVTSTGNNLLTSVHSTLTTKFNQPGDLISSTDYVVTSLVDSFDPTDDDYALSLREAIDLANEDDGHTSGTAETIWLPAWNFVLTRERQNGVGNTDTDVAWGDLDIKDSLKVRGITASLTRVQWARAAAKDATFDLLGDYNGNGVAGGTTDNGDVNGQDFLKWQQQYLSGVGSPLLNTYSADGDDDGDVDGDDRAIWEDYYGNELVLENLDAILA